MSAAEQAKTDTDLNREIRVFLSSTFKDMEAERNYLLKHIFPELRAKCAERQVGFTEIDLRWRVTEEESKNGKTVELCLLNIDRCRDYPPFFIGFMGERYGWIPEDHHLIAYWKEQPPDESTGDYASPYAQAIQTALKQGISVTELEMKFGMFDQPDYVQAHALFYLRDANYTQTLYEQAKTANPQLAETAFYSDTRPKDDALLAQLKDKIRASGHLLIDNYTRVEDFGEDIKAKLLAELDARFLVETVPTTEERVLREHARYAQSRRQAYIPLPSMHDSVNSAIQQAAGRIYSKPILIYGESGLALKKKPTMPIIIAKPSAKTQFFPISAHQLTQNFRNLLPVYKHLIDLLCHATQENPEIPLMVNWLKPMPLMKMLRRKFLGRQPKLQKQYLHSYLKFINLRNKAKGLLC